MPRPNWCQASRAWVSSWGAVIASEIDDIGRFPDTEHLCAYAGLVPTTHGSGGKIYHGQLLWSANKWLRWAFIEGAWVAVGCSGYFGAIYKAHRARGKKANTAITIVARRICQIVWHLLQEKNALTSLLRPPVCAEEFPRLLRLHTDGPARKKNGRVLGQNGEPGI